MERADYEILINSMPPSRDGKGPPDYAIKLLEDTCAKTGLDWKLRHVYLMQRGGKWGITLSIDGFRLIGSQDPDYAGQEGPLWTTGPDVAWSDIPPDGPVYAAKVGIRHRTGITTWGVAKFKDYKAGPMWDKFPSTMSAKCAEMLAWRKAMPGRLGGLYGLEEMAQADKAAAKLVETVTKTVETLSPGDIDAAKNAYILGLEKCPDLAAVKTLGGQISADPALTMQAKLELHEVYNKMKGKYAQ